MVLGITLGFHPTPTARTVYTFTREKTFKQPVSGQLAVPVMMHSSAWVFVTLVSVSLADMISVTPVVTSALNAKNVCGNILANAAFLNSGFPFSSNAAFCEYNNMIEVGTFTSGPLGLPTGAIITTGRAASAVPGSSPANFNWGTNGMNQAVAESYCTGDINTLEWSALRVSGMYSDDPNINTMRVSFIFATNEDA